MQAYSLHKQESKTFAEQESLHSTSSIFHFCTFLLFISLLVSKLKIRSPKRTYDRIRLLVVCEQIKSWCSYELYLWWKWKGKHIGKLSVKLHQHLRLRCVINYFAGDVFALQYFSAHQVMINEEGAFRIVYNGTCQRNYKCKIRQMILLFVVLGTLFLVGSRVN